MQRALVVLSAPLSVESIRERCAFVASQPGDVAICYVLPDGDGTTAETLRVQRMITTGLRQTLGPLAESIPIFVASSHDGESIEDYARAWGATEVVR